MRSIARCGLLAAAILVAGPAGPASANFVVNGSFETPPISGGTFGIYANIPGWSGGTNGIEIQNNVAGSPFDGNQFVELDTTANSSMTQLVAVGPGAYTLSFAYSPRPGISAASNPVEVYWDGNLLTTLTGNGSGNTVWTVYNFNVAATGPTNLEFRAVGVSDSLGGYIDAVSVASAVPEPASVIMLLSGAAMAVPVLRRRKAVQA